MAPRYKGHAGFDLKLMGVEGASKLMDMIGEEPGQFQNVRSMYLGVAVEGLDEYVDDMLASALNMLSPGNVPHGLEKVKIFIAGVDYMEMHAKSVCSPSASCDAPLQTMLFNRNPPASLLQSKGVVYYQAERAFIRALLSIRGVKRIEVEGPMPAELKKRIGACLTTRPGCKVRNWKGEQSAFRTDAEIGWGTWMASMQSRDEKIDDTVGPDGVELADTTTIHHELDVSFHVTLPVPPSPRLDQDRTIWNKSPFKYSSPDPNEVLGCGTHITAAAMQAFVDGDALDPHSSSPMVPSDPEDDDFDPNANSLPVKRPFTTRTPVPDHPRKRRCIRKSSSLSTAALDAYDAKKVVGFPPSPPGKLHRVNYAAPNVKEDFGQGTNESDPSKRISWFRSSRHTKQQQWVLPTSKGAHISVATKLGREGRMRMREERRKEMESEGIEQEDDDDVLLSDSEDEDDDESNVSDGSSTVKKEISDSDADSDMEKEKAEVQQGLDVELEEYDASVDVEEQQNLLSTSSPMANDEDEEDDSYDDNDSSGEEQPSS